MILTGNRTREVHDALKRRCLYHWIDYPDLEREVAIVRVRAPEVSERLGRQVAEVTQRLRGLDLYKVPGVAETVDWARALAALGSHRGDAGSPARDHGRGDQAPGGPPAERGGDRGARRTVIGNAPDPVESVTLFARLLRDAGLTTGPERVRDACEALLAIDLERPDEVRYALRAVFVTRREEGPVFDAAFDLFFSRPGGEGRAGSIPGTQPAPGARSQTGAGVDERARALVSRASRARWRDLRRRAPGTAPRSCSASATSAR